VGEVSLGEVNPDDAGLLANFGHDRCMKAVYEASNAVEAHMVLNLLQQQGLSGRVDGEYLQGAMGQLPASGLVRVVVDEQDYDAALAVVQAWDAAQPNEAGAANRAGPKRPWLNAGVGLLVGVLATYALLRAPVTSEGVDHDRDGVLDERWTYTSNGLPLRLEADRNLDHRVDYIAQYDRRGEITTAEADDDFDGRFESHHVFRYGNMERSDIDTDGDSFADLRLEYREGVQVSASFIEPRTGLAVRVEHLRLGKLTDAELDSDDDGVLDTRLRYNSRGDVAARERLP
jgi:hypothetical protein